MTKIIYEVTNNTITNAIIVTADVDPSAYGCISAPDGVTWGIGYVWDEASNTFIDPNALVPIQPDLNEAIQAALNEL